VKYAQCVKIWLLMTWFCSEACAVFEVLYSVSGGHYTESGNSSVSNEEKGRHTHATRVSYLRRRETHPHNAHLVSQERTSLFYLICTKKNAYRIFSKGSSLCQHATCPLAHIHERMCGNGHPVGLAQEAPHGA
jgi:hypothetical protein